MELKACIPNNLRLRYGYSLLFIVAPFILCMLNEWNWKHAHHANNLRLRYGYSLLLNVAPFILCMLNEWNWKHGHHANNLRLRYGLKHLLKLFQKEVSGHN